MSVETVVSAPSANQWWTTRTFPESFSSKPFIKVIQITDCHLYAETDGEYFGAKCYPQLEQTCLHIHKANADLVVLTGDITNDHTEKSYQRLAEIVNRHLFDIPIAWLPGNHDEIQLMETYFSAPPFICEKHLILGNWQLFLMNSKGPTPAGFVQPELLESQQHLLEKHKIVAPYAAAFMHHHPIPMNAYIDKHICENGDAVLNVLTNESTWRFLAHGHVHTERASQHQHLQVLATPSTSIQFGQSKEWQQIDSGPAYRVFELYPSGDWKTQVVNVAEVAARDA